MIDVLQPDLNLEEILKKAGIPLDPQRTYEFANNLPPGPEGTHYPVSPISLNSFGLEWDVEVWY